LLSKLNYLELKTNISLLGHLINQMNGVLYHRPDRVMVYGLIAKFTPKILWYTALATTNFIAS
jgi:hypothetical protein